MVTAIKSMPVHVFIVTIKPDHGIGLDDQAEVRLLIEGALRDSGMSDGCSIIVEPWDGS